MSEESQAAHIQINVPPALEVGTYANFLGVWHTGHEFTLDFAVLQANLASKPDDSSDAVTVPAQVVQRIRVAPTLVFEIIRALNQNMTKYEQIHGEIRQLRPSEEEPGA